MPTTRTVRLVDVRSTAAKVNSFELVINETFPVPEITRVDFQTDKDFLEITGLKIKAKITGDFLDDEWFWADYLK